MIAWLFAARCFISGGFQVTFVYTPEVNFIFNTNARYLDFMLTKYDRDTQISPKRKFASFLVSGDLFHTIHQCSKISVYCDISFNRRYIRQAAELLG